MRERIRALMAGVFGVDPADLPDDPAPERMEEWTSLKHVELMLALEEELDIVVDPEIAPRLASLDALTEFAEANVRPPAPA